VIGPLIVSLAAGAVFVRVELASPSPLMDLRLLRRHRNYLGATVSQFIAGIAEMGLGLLFPLLLILNLGMSPALAGLALIPTTLPMVVGAPLAGRWYDRSGGRPPLVVGFGVLALSGIALTLGVHALGPESPNYPLLLPGLVLAIYTVGMLTRFTRASMLEIMGNDYVRAARLKGLPEHTVILRHVLRPALISVITVAGLAFANLLSGTVLVENIFGWPGIGQYAYHSAVNLDLPAIMGVSLFIALVYIVINIIVDLLYGVIDPRIRLS